MTARLLATFVGVIVVALAGLLFSMPTTAQTSTCEVPASYHEAVNENNFTLLKVLGMVNSPASPLDDTGIAYVYYANLTSMRHYHEDIRSDLPDCAQTFNIVVVETISASQDAVTTLIAHRSEPDNRRYQSRREQALDHLDETWQILGPSFEESNLVPALE